MTKVEKNVIVGAPLEKVYAFATDWRNLDRYFVYVQDVEPTTEDTSGEGARFDLTVKFLGLTRVSHWECTERTENVGWTCDATLFGLKAVKRWRFVPVDGTTMVTFTLEYKPAPPVIGWIMDVLLIRPQWNRLYEKSFKELKQLIESEAASSN